MDKKNIKIKRDTNEVILVGLKASGEKAEFRVFLDGKFITNSEVTKAGVPKGYTAFSERFGRSLRFTCYQNAGNLEQSR